MRSDTLSLSEARRIVLAAQGLDRPRPSGRIGPREVSRVVRRLGVLQLDFINVVAPAHYQILFSRLGPYDRSILDDVVYRRRQFTEQWAHEASIVPVETWPLLRHRMETHRVRPYGFEGFLAQQPDYAAAVLEEVRARGPLPAIQLPAPTGVSRRLPETWFGTVPRAVLEAHFGRGLLGVAARLPSFARTYDLAERVIPEKHFRRPVGREEAQRELLCVAARGLGVATVADLADYFRMPVRDARPRVAELVEAGEVREVQIEGWRELAYLHTAARLPRKAGAAALLSPFDPLIWFRPRTQRLFGFDYRMEVFVPAAKRRWGCYVLPYLLGESLVARLDLKCDRGRGRLVVPAAYIEPHAEPDEVAGPLASELGVLAAWLGLDAVAVGRKGNFARRLASVMMRTGVHL